MPEVNICSLVTWQLFLKILNVFGMQQCGVTTAVTQPKEEVVVGDFFFEKKKKRKEKKSVA